MASRLPNFAALVMMRLFRRNTRARTIYTGSLVDMDEGEVGLIEEVIGDSRVTIRLRELGATPGVRVRLLKSGCPTVIQVEEGRFCLRQKDAATIRVKKRV